MAVTLPQTHPLLPRGCAVPRCGVAYFLRCVPRDWYASRTYPTNQNKNIKQNNKQRNSTRLGPGQARGHAVPRQLVNKVSFKRRLVSPGQNPVKIQILSNGNAILIPQPRSFYSERLNVLRRICGIPNCRFNRMPKAVLYKLGYNVEKINEIIDQTMNSKVGGAPNESSELTETIQGATRFGDGYEIKNYNNFSRVDILVSFNRYVGSSYMCKFVLEFKYDKNQKLVDIIVSLVKAYSTTPGQPYCRPFSLFSRTDSQQFRAKILLASILVKVPDYAQYCGVYFGKLYGQRITAARSMIFTACQQYLTYMRSKVGSAQKPISTASVNKKNSTPNRCSVLHFTRRNGYEYFVVKFNDGKTFRINNSRFAIKEMYNLTLTNGCYYIHPKCFTPSWERFESCGNRFCWIPAFAKANIRMPRDLVPYPELNYGYLIQCGLESVLNGRLKKVRDGYFHFDVNYNSNVKNLRFGSKVGVKLDNDMDGILKNIELLYDDISAGIISGCQLRGDNPLINTITSRLSNQINEACKLPKDLVIPTCMTSRQKRELSEAFPEINFDFKESSYSTHALATAMRHAENYLLARKYGFKDFIDAGGDVTHYLGKMVSNVHVCSPIVDIKDSHRHTTRSNKLDRMIGVCEDVDMCENLTQNCSVVKPNIIAVEVYDMTLVDYARALLSHKAKRVDFSVIIPPEIYDEDCDVSLFDDSVNVKCEGDTVVYSYGSSGESYQHNRENLKQILATQIFEVDGVIFKKTLESSRKQLHFYSVVPCSDMINGRYVVETHYSRSELDRLYIRVPVEDERMVLQHMKIKMDKANFHSLVEYAMNTVLRLDEKAYEYIMSQYRARKSISIKGGKVTQVGADLHPKAVSSLVGTIAGYALRLREQSHKSAKLAYSEYYTPSLFRMICKIIAIVLKKIFNWTSLKLTEVIKYITPASILKEISSNQCCIYEFQGEYRFKQDVTIVGQKRHRHILTESFEKFKKYTEKVHENLEMYTAGKEELFNTDIQTTLNEIFDLGGAGNVSHCGLDGLKLLSFSTYNRIYSLLMYWLNDEKRAIKYTNYICAVWDYFRNFSLSAIDFVKSALVDIFMSIKTGVATMSDTVAKNLRRAAKTMHNIIKRRNADWEQQLEDMLAKTDEIYGSTLPSKIPKENVKHDSEDTLNIEALFDLGNEGGSYSFNYKLKPVSNTIMRVTTKFIHNAKVICIKFVNYLLKISGLVREKYETFRSFLIKTVNKMCETESIVTIINGVSFTVANLFVAAILGDVNFLRLFVASCMSVFYRVSKVGQRWFGSDAVGDAMASLITTPNYLGLLVSPVKVIASRALSARLKWKISPFVKDEVKALTIIGGEVNNKYNFDWFNPQFLRHLLGVATMILLISPRFGFCLIISLILLNDYVKFLRTRCVGANIFLSYGSVLKRTVPSEKYKRLKSIFAKKFNTSILNPKQNNIEEDVIESGGEEEICRVGAKPIDSDVEVELDYSGKEIKNDTKHINWGSDVSSVNASDHIDGLNFSVLNPTVDRTQINCSVQFPLSHALLSFPMTDYHDFIPTGEELIDCVSEFYHLEAKKLHDEMGRLNNAVRTYFEQTLQGKSVRDAVWAMRNWFNDTSVYINLDSKNWYRLGKGDKGPATLEASCKYTIENNLIDFTTKSPGVVFCSDELVGMFCNKRCLALEPILKQNLDKIRAIRSKDVVFYNKPPGAGKTTTIVNSMYDDVKKGVVSVALTHTSNGKKEIIEKLKKRGVSAAQKMVYTYDSVLMNATEAAVDKVYCDEIFMVHAGEWLATMSLFKTNVIQCYGDRNQIPFINRVAHTTCRYHKDTYLSFKTIDDNISYRCPVDVCYLLSTLTDETGQLLYPNGVYPAGDNREVFRSMEVEPINSVHDVTHDSKAKCISFTRPEREEIDASLQRSGVSGQSVQTVHEVQGGTFPTVYLHRLRKYDNPLYENINQFVVSISRHTERMKYRVITDKLFDKIGERISAISSVQDYVIKEYMFKQRV
uniref:1a polyprotein n=1 Tax=Soybean mild yellows Bangladesh virus TaxID=3074303 RepID=A0AA51UQC4_9VIRU|nr:1a polyprotein [Soybean mild yellows Bangladesh virus]